MAYIIFIVVALTILWIYFRIKYCSSFYEKFEYYLSNEYGDIAGLILFWECILRIAAFVAIIYLGGQLVKLII